MSTRLDIGDGTGLDKIVTRLVEIPPSKPKELAPLPPAAPIGPARGAGKAAAPRATTGQAVSGQVWTETAREYWPDQIATSSDGLFILVVKPIKRVVFDANGTTREDNYLNV